VRHGRHGGRTKPRVTPVQAVRASLFALGGGALAYAAFAQSVGAITQTRDPLLALRLNPSNPIALAVHADRLTAGNPNSLIEDRAEIVQLARRSVNGLAVNPRAVRVLAFGVEGAGKKDQARRLIDLASRLSRRDLLTQLWLIEDNVGRDDAAQALVHYDVALRANRNAGSVLYPVLASAITDSALWPAFGPYIKRPAPWLSEFSQFVLEQQTGETALAELFIRYGKAPNVSTESTLLAQLIAKGEYTLARRYYGSIQGANNAVLTSIGFSTTHTNPRFVPVTWQPISSSAIAAALERGPDGTQQFHIAADANVRETALRKFLMLAPGAYRLDVDQRLIASGTGAETHWEIRCLRGQAPAVVAGQLASGKSAELTIPANCPAQYLDLVVSGGTEGADLSVIKVGLRRL
jgi:hypothetical protein